MSSVSGIHVEQPSSVYQEKPKLPMKRENNPYSTLPILNNNNKTKTPSAQTVSKTQQKENQIIAKIRQIANTIGSGFSNQVQQIVQVCNSLDGTNKWTEREMELLNKAERIVAGSGQRYSK